MDFSYLIQQRGIAPYFTSIERMSLAYYVTEHLPSVEYSIEKEYGERNVMFTRKSFGRPSFGKNNYIQFLKEMNNETRDIANLVFTDEYENGTRKERKEFVDKWMIAFNENLQDDVINPVIVGKRPVLEIHSVVKSPFTGIEAAFIFKVKEGMTITKGLLLYANNMALQHIDLDSLGMVQDYELGMVQDYAIFQYDGGSAVDYLYDFNEPIEKGLVIRCKFNIELIPKIYDDVDVSEDSDDSDIEE